MARSNLLQRYRRSLLGLPIARGQNAFDASGTRNLTRWRRYISSLLDIRPTSAPTSRTSHDGSQALAEVIISAPAAAPRPSRLRTSLGTAMATTMAVISLIIAVALLGPLAPTSKLPSATTASNTPPNSPSATCTTAPTSTPAIFAQVHVSVYDASGVSQRATYLKNVLVTDGFALATVGGTVAKTPTTLYYPSTRADSAAAVAYVLAIPCEDMVETTAYTEVAVVIGEDWPSGNTYPGH